MNKKLITSWFHVFMVVALFAIGFAVFEGVSFYSGGDFGLAGFATIVCCIVIFLFFFIPQQLKGSSGNFDKRIWFERFFVLFLAPLSLLMAMLPISHFLNIQRQSTQIVNQFSVAVDTAKTMFSDYEEYADTRINRYGYKLRHRKPLERQNSMRALRLQLLSNNYDTLRTSALQWIDVSITEPSTLNVFLLGNIDEIEHAIRGWNRQLEQFSYHRMSDESERTGLYTMPSGSTEAACFLLEDLRSLYRQSSLSQLLTVPAFITLLVLWFFLMLPYFAQRRHSKSAIGLGITKQIAENQFMFYWGK